MKTPSKRSTRGPGRNAPPGWPSDAGNLVNEEKVEAGLAALANLGYPPHCCRPNLGRLMRQLRDENPSLLLALGTEATRELQELPPSAVARMAPDKWPAILGPDDDLTLEQRTTLELRAVGGVLQSHRARRRSTSPGNRPRLATRLADLYIRAVEAVRHHDGDLTTAYCGLRQWPEFHVPVGDPPARGEAVKPYDARLDLLITPEDIRVMAKLPPLVAAGYEVGCTWASAVARFYRGHRTLVHRWWLAKARRRLPTRKELEQVLFSVGRSIRSRAR